MEKLTQQHYLEILKKQCLINLGTYDSRKLCEQIKVLKHNLNIKLVCLI